jgi:hypothetical protein
MDIDRKHFLLYLSGGAATLLGAGCGGGGGYSSPSVSPASLSCTATISGDHGHLLTIPAADLDSTASRTYDIQYTANHSHTVTFTAAQLAQLKAGTTVVVTSTVGAGAGFASHSHDISERCV